MASGYEMTGGDDNAITPQSVGVNINTGFAGLGGGFFGEASIFDYAGGDPPRSRTRDADELFPTSGGVQFAVLGGGLIVLLLATWAIYRAVRQ